MYKTKHLLNVTYVLGYSMDTKQRDEFCLLLKIKLTKQGTTVGNYLSVYLYLPLSSMTVGITIFFIFTAAHYCPVPAHLIDA